MKKYRKGEFKASKRYVEELAEEDRERVRAAEVKAKVSSKEEADFFLKKKICSQEEVQKEKEPKKQDRKLGHRQDMW